jgi:hypothetical protein
MIFLFSQAKTHSPIIVRFSKIYPKRRRPQKPPFPLFIVVPGAGLEPARGHTPRDFKSLASTRSATQAGILVITGILLLCSSLPKPRGGHKRLFTVAAPTKACKSVLAQGYFTACTHQGQIPGSRHYTRIGAPLQSPLIMAGGLGPWKTYRLIFIPAAPNQIFPPRAPVLHPGPQAFSPGPSC